MKRKEGSLKASEENFSPLIEEFKNWRKLFSSKSNMNQLKNSIIYVESLSDEDSNLENLKRLEESKEYIRVENNEDNYDKCKWPLYPHRNFITEKIVRRNYSLVNYI